MQPSLSLNVWCSLPNEVRFRLRSLFNIPRSSNTEVNDGVIVSDGTTFEDIKVLTTEKMQSYLVSTDTDFHKLFDGVVAKVNDDIVKNAITEMPKPPETITIPKKEYEQIINANKKKNEKKNKQNKKTLFIRGELYYEKGNFIGTDIVVGTGKIAFHVCRVSLAISFIIQESGCAD